MILRIRIFRHPWTPGRVQPEYRSESRLGIVLIASRFSRDKARPAKILSLFGFASTIFFLSRYDTRWLHDDATHQFRSLITGEAALGPQGAPPRGGLVLNLIVAADPRRVRLDRPHFGRTGRAPGVLTSRLVKALPSPDFIVDACCVELSDFQ